MNRRRTMAGVLATAIVGWSLPVALMIRSMFALSSSGDRATQLFGVVFVALLAIPAAGLVGVGFLPAHALLARRSRRGFAWYAAWGVVMMCVLLALAAVLNPSAEMRAEDATTWAAIVLGVGTLEGLVFWLVAVRSA